VSGWQRTALIGIARLSSAALGATPEAVLAAAVPDAIRSLFGRGDEARRAHAFAVEVAGVMAVAVGEGADPGTVESARLAASEALARHGLTDGQVVALDLDPGRAARAVMDRVRFSADERAEIAPLVERALVAFYRAITTRQATFPEFMPAIHAEMLRRSRSAEEAAERRHREVMAAIARDKGVPIPPLLDVLCRLGHAEVAPEQIPSLLEAAAERLRELEERLAQPSNDRPEIQAARAEARALIDAGELDRAEAVLREARAGLRALREQTAREEAALLTDEAGVAAARLAFGEAAERHREAARLLEFDAEAAWAAWQRGAEALYILGRDFGDPAMLRRAVAWLEREALPRAPRATRPLAWAAIQNDLGLALAALGERGDDAALREAVAAYRAALEERTRERVPLDWATTQNNLGIVLRTLGARGDDAALREAVAAFRAALEERTRERVPLQWATIQNNLALALWAQAERTRQCAPITEALAAIDGAIEEFTKRDAPYNLDKARRNRAQVLATARNLDCS
jgi:hypothetical protein